MSRHTITEQELNEWLSNPVWYQAASSSGPGSSKRLEISNSGLYRVTDRGTLVYNGIDKTAAVEAYNKAP